MYSIIGGGIGGLTTALAFEKLGIDYQLYEKANDLKPVGSGILLPPNALQVFQWLGILDELMKKGNSMKRITLTDQNMSSLFDYQQDDIKEKFGFYSLSIHRWELQKILLHKLPESKIHLGKSLISFNQLENNIDLLFADSTVVRTKFLIGADGIHSNVRKHLFPKSQIRYSGQTCWRGICTFSDTFEEYQHRGIEMWGVNGRFGITKIEENRFYWFAVVNSPQNLKDELGEVKRKLSKVFNRFHPMVKHLINETSEKNIIKGDLSDLKPMSRWYKENVCLLGDAAHATTPNMGQGGAQAIEDAYFLAKIIKMQKNVNAFKVFQEKRMKKVNLIVRRSRLMGIIGHWRYFTGIRNFVLKNTPRSILKEQWGIVYKLKS